ncbi:MAG: PLP-dependent transferase [Atopobiaceae bacterium]|nr:PLP-dependent transferase [Atopobiaceae bacterium]
MAKSHDKLDVSEIGKPQALVQAQRDCAKRLGAQRAYILSAPSFEALVAELGLVDGAQGAPEGGAQHGAADAAQRAFEAAAQQGVDRAAQHGITARFVNILGDAGLEVAHLPTMKSQAEAAGELLICDNTSLSCGTCAACRLGAHLSIEELTAGSFLVGLSSDVHTDAPKLEAQLAQLQSQNVPDANQQHALLDHLATLDERCRKQSDNAAVIARYLSCHPKVGWCAYPGLANHPSRSYADKIIVGGFGPHVDLTLRPASSEDYVRVVRTFDEAARGQSGTAPRLKLRRVDLRTAHPHAANERFAPSAQGAPDTQLADPAQQYAHSQSGASATPHHYLRYTAGTGSARDEVMQFEGALFEL